MTKLWDKILNDNIFSGAKKIEEKGKVGNNVRNKSLTLCLVGGRTILRGAITTTMIAREINY